MDPKQFLDNIRSVLQAEGYRVVAADPAASGNSSPFWHYVLHDEGQLELARGAPCPDETEAWSSALLHRMRLILPVAGASLASAPSSSKPMGNFYPAKLPPWLLEPERLAERYQISLEDAQRQSEILASQSVYVNQSHQVNVSVVKEPFGAEYGDMAWLSIKRRDRAPIHDWRELQEVKNLLIGPQHEGFEIYPAESRLVDTANQYHVFVFLNAAVRMPVGFQTRAVASAAQAAEVGAVQRDFGPI